MNKFTLGVITGVAVGLLTAPARGATLRHKISDSANAWKHRINHLLGRGESDLDELKETLQDAGTELNAELRMKLITLVDRSKKHYERMREENDED